MKSKEVVGNTENIYRLQVAETKLAELQAAMSTLGKEAVAAMVAVEGQQQRLTLQRLIAMVSIQTSITCQVLWNEFLLHFPDFSCHIYSCNFVVGKTTKLHPLGFSLFQQMPLISIMCCLLHGPSSPLTQLHVPFEPLYGQFIRHQGRLGEQ